MFSHSYTHTLWWIKRHGTMDTFHMGTLYHFADNKSQFISCLCSRLLLKVKISPPQNTWANIFIVSYQHHWREIRLRRAVGVSLTQDESNPQALLSAWREGRSKAGHLYCCWPLANQWNIAQLWLVLWQNTDVWHDFIVIKGFARHLKTSGDRNEMIK